MKRQSKKLSLNRETLRALATPSLLLVNGALLPEGGNNTREISICVGCTKKIDHCPDQTATIG